MEKKKKLLYIVLAVAFFLLVYVLGGVFYMLGEGNIDLSDVPLVPPPIVFTIAWTVLYALLAASFALVLIKTEGKGWPLFVLNGLLGPLWMLVFFVQGNAFGALVLVVVMIALALLLFRRVFDIDRTAAWLILPYILWLGFAFVLTYNYSLLN